jgi:hypothetical protein
MLRGMRSVLRTLYTVTGAIGVLLLAIPAIVHAEGGPELVERPDELDRWVPAFGIYSGVLGQQIEGNVSSCCRKIFTEPIPGAPPGTPPRPVNPPRQTTLPLSPPAEGDDLLIVPFVGGNIELSSPGWRGLPGSPRFFIRGDASAAFSLEKDVARDGAPDELVDPERPNFTPAGVAGQGSTTSVRVEPLVISAGAGIAFTFEAFDRRFRIKPSVEYMREQTRVRGQVLVAQNVRPGRSQAPPPMPQTEINSTFRFLELEGEKKRWFNGIGPGLEIEMDAARAGPFMLTLYASGQAFHWLGDRNIEIEPGELSVSYSGPHLDFPPPFNFDPDTVPNDESARWTYKRNRWGYRGGIGIRFRWQPD